MQEAEKEIRNGGIEYVTSKSIERHGGSVSREEEGRQTEALERHRALESTFVPCTHTHAHTQTHTYTKGK